MKRQSAASPISPGFPQLKKLAIEFEKGRPDSFTGLITALFNPAELKYSRDVQWKSSAIPGQAIAGGFQRLEFQSCQPLTLSLDLFFDTYEGDSGSSLNLLQATNRLMPVMVPSQLFETTSATAVDSYTRQLEQLATVDRELHRPPRCRLHWGQYTLIEGVLTHMGEDFSFFLANGTPVRASVACTFQEFVPYEERARAFELHSSDVYKTRVVRRGDTLSSLAAEEYHDPSQWRLIARANKIHNPRSIRPGQVLIVPVQKS